VCAAALVLAAAAGAAGLSAPKLKLPAERTSPTGNFFTLEAYAAPAAFEVKVCTSSHTPAGTAIDPALFTVSLAGGGVVSESSASARSPALPFKGLKPLECAAGWLGFPVPKGRTVRSLNYSYGGTIVWDVG
jgi:hypothetical protein